MAEAAYDEAADDPDSQYARIYGRSFMWTCPACRGTVRDRGLCNGPADDEQGHADGCSRLAGTIGDWEAEWDEKEAGR